MSKPNKKYSYLQPSPDDALASRPASTRPVARSSSSLARSSVGLSSGGGVTGEIDCLKQLTMTDMLTDRDVDQAPSSSKGNRPTTPRSLSYSILYLTQKAINQKLICGGIVTSSSNYDSFCARGIDCPYNGHMKKHDAFRSGHLFCWVLLTLVKLEPFWSRISII